MLDKMDKDQQNPVEIITKRLENWQSRVRHKKETLDMYIKHINIIREAFDQIKKATGISNIQEIVVTFIKSQEQTDSLNNHLNTLDQEIDVLEEQKAELTKELRSKEGTIAKHRASNDSMADILLKQRDEMKTTTTAKENELEKVKKTINNIQGPVSNMIKKFKESSISLSVAEDKIYDETTTFNEQNINEYLSEVEEYIKCLLTVMAKEFGFEHPLLIALGLKDLPAKEIKSEPINKDLLTECEEVDEEPDDATLNDMLDRTKFDTMVTELLEKRKEHNSRSVAEESNIQEESIYQVKT
jgi:hypothetical protein